MPAIAPNSKILVTGANGYLAVWVVRVLLERGYSVRGTVRSEAKASHLRKIFSSYGDKHEVVIVEDITKEGAFDKAVQGIDAITHIASPVDLSADDPDDLIVPAVQGTVGILKSTLQYGADVQRMVITASTATILTPDPPKPRLFTEEDWNETSIQVVKEQGRKASQMDKYRASKTLAEKSAWEFYEKHKSSIKWDICVLHPPWIFGPPLQDVTSPAQLNESSSILYKAVIEADAKAAAATSSGGSWVDVRDVSLAHALALEKEAAGGERIIISSGPFFPQDWIICANALTPPIYENLSKGDPNYDPATSDALLKYNNAKSRRILGIEYKGMAETTKDLLEDFKSRGW